MDASRQVSGVISQRDLLVQLIRILARCEQAGEAPPDPNSIGTVAELIQSSPITVPPELPILKAAAILATNKIGCLPVVDEQGGLLGMLGINEVLSAVTRKIGLQEFEFFTPSDGQRRKAPAYFRRVSRSLILPLETVGHVDPSMLFAQLGYNHGTGRIVVKFTADKCEGARKICRERECLTVPASDFVSHYEIRSDGSAYEVVNHTGYLVLVPKQSSGDPPASSGSRRRGL
jgi:hypothetical protein